jgi:Ca2+-binding RTX toxin-like protein
MGFIQMENAHKTAMIQRYVQLGSLLFLIVGVNSVFFGLGGLFIYGKNTPSLDIDDNYHLGSLTQCADIVKQDNLISTSCEVIYGTNHADTILVKSNINLDAALFNSHTVLAKSSDDIVTGSDQPDMIFGQAGDDLLQGGFGNDQLDGGDGNDALAAGPNNDYLIGGDGNDKLFGDADDDILQGGDGADSFNCGLGIDTVLDYNPQQGDVITDDCELVDQ